MPPEPDDDPHWLAFLYVSDELSDADRAAFEARLDRDQEAREAVAEAVGMVEAVALLPADAGAAPSRPLRLAPPIRRRLGWLATAACLAAASLPALRGLRPSDAEAVAPAPDPAPAGVALAWSGSLDDRGGEPGDPELLSWIGASAGLEAPDAGPAGEGAASPPSWLLLAASAPAADADHAEQRED